MTWNEHNHRGEYAGERHDHDLDYAERHHRHSGLETDGKTAQQGITCLQDEVAELRRQLDAALERIGDLEKQTPQARQLQLEADQAAADLAASGYIEGLSTECRDRWHDRCPPGVLCNCECHLDDEDQADEPGFPLIPPGQIDAEVTAGVRRLTGKDSS
jgi:hypothetical protein